MTDDVSWISPHVVDDRRSRSGRSEDTKGSPRSASTDDDEEVDVYAEAVTYPTATDPVGSSDESEDRGNSLREVTDDRVVTGWEDVGNAADEVVVGDARYVADWYSRYDGSDGSEEVVADR